MATFTQSLMLDVAGRNRYKYVYAKQGDSGSRFVNVTMLANGVQIVPESGTTAKIRALKPDGTGVYNPATINANGTITAALTSQMLAVKGDVQADIMLVGSNNEILSTVTFYITVEEAPAGEAIVSSNEFLELIELRSVATQAASDANEAKNVALDAQSAAEEAAQDAQDNADALNISSIYAAIGEKGDNLWFNEEDGKLYLMSEGEPIGDGVVVATSGGGGGGSQSNEYTMSLTNLLPSRLITVADGTTVSLQFSYASVDTESGNDGAGVGAIVVNNVTKATIAVPQGDSTVNVTDFLSAGTNTVKIRVTNSEGSMKTLSYTVSVVSLSISTTFDEMGSYSGSVVFSYTPSGVGEKTIHFVMDGTELDTATVTSNNRSQSFTIPAQTHGAHIFECYATMTVDGVAVQSNVITLGMMWIDETSNVPIVLCPFTVTAATQGENLTIPFMVYDPSTESASVSRDVIDMDNTVYAHSSVTVDRTAQSWSVNDYPVGTTKFKITCGSASVTKTVTVSESSIVIEPVTDGLVLEFSAVGRSNGEDHPDAWSYGDVSASFSGFGWTGADGWVDDSDGNTALRFLPNDFMAIPFKPFESDARASGFTVEAEFATRDVQDYDSIVFSCLSGGRGFSIGSQYAELKSEQSQVSMQFKEDSHVRVCFVVENRNLNRFVYIYINGVMCGVSQYPTNDDFSQAAPVGLTIGAESCGIDLYRVRIYGKGLTRSEQLDNFIYDRPTLVQREAAYHRNDVLNANEEVDVAKLPATLPYMIISCPELPQYKGDKKTGVSVTYVNPADTSKSFTATGVEMDVQGTSSAGYPVKNYKQKYKSGVTYTASGEMASKYKLRNSSIAVSTFCLKADFASSENANNVKLVDFYESLCPYQTPPQQSDGNVRQGIDGLPMVVFWQDTYGNVTFIGKYNFNNDKSTGEVFGFTASYPNAESWEFKNNTSNRCLLKVSDYTDDNWLNDFEGRYPKDNTDYTQFKRVTDWIASTDRDAVSSDADKAARLSKFANEFETYFIKSAMLFYYLFTEVFLMIDSRAKNMFLTTYDGTHWLPLPYDYDTALGINNEGVLVFDYDLEDTDYVGGAKVFNGQTSVLWCNVRDAFANDLKTMYKNLRSAGTFSYAAVKEMFTAHQSVWPEAIWNEDAFVKYLQPYLIDGENYLSMLQGSKESQRDWWLFNAFKYRDSKYQAGEALSSFITLRCYALGDITITPYSHIWATVKYGSYTVTTRGKRNVAYTLENPMDQMNDTEVYVYSADRISSVGDLSGLQVGYANFSMATKLQSLKLGSSAAGYENTNLKELYVGNNELLKTIDVQNCTALGTDQQKSIDLSGCLSLESVLAEGTEISGVELPNGGHLETLKLPDTITNFTILNQKNLETLTFEGLSALTTLRAENTPNIDVENIVNSASNLNRVRMIGIEWNATSQSTLQETITKLESCIGMNAAGENTSTAVVTGTVDVPTISAELLMEINAAFPELVVLSSGEAQYIVRFVDYDNTVLYREVVAANGNAVNPVTAGYITAPTRAGTENTGYVFRDFGTLPTNVNENRTVYAVYDTTYRVQFINNGEVYNTQWVVSGNNATTPSGTPTKPSTAQYSYTFTGWDKAYTNVTQPLTVNAQYSQALRHYTVRFYNGSTLLQTVNNVPYGGTANYTGSTPVDSANNWEFGGWSPSNVNIQGDTSCYAQFISPYEYAEIADSWQQIIASVDDGTYASKYHAGNYKPLDLGSEGIINMQIVAIDKDIKAGGGTAPITWISEKLLATSHRMNPALVAKKPAVKYNANQYKWVEDTTGTNKYKSANQNVDNAESTGLWVVTPSGTGSLTIAWTVDSESYDKLSIYADGAEKLAPTGGAGKNGTVIINCTANTAVNIFASYKKDSSTGSNADTATITLSADFAFSTVEGADGTEIAPSVPAVTGTGSIGGWEHSEMRSWLKSTIKPLIPSEVSSRIVEVSKATYIYNPDETVTKNAITTDDVWIPSEREIFGGTGRESEGTYYSSVFNSAEMRKKMKANGSSATFWWLRSANSTTLFRLVNSNGNVDYGALNSGGVALGFCM